MRLPAIGGGRVIEVAGRITEEGVCAERLPRDAQWTVRARLSPWAESGGMPTREPLEIVHRAPTAALQALQRAWPPGADVRVRVRLSGASLRAELVRPL
jgi:hypothetical protein